MPGDEGESETVLDEWEPPPGFEDEGSK